MNSDSKRTTQERGQLIARFFFQVTQCVKTGGNAQKNVGFGAVEGSEFKCYPRIEAVSVRLITQQQGHRFTRFFFQITRTVILIKTSPNAWNYGE